MKPLIVANWKMNPATLAEAKRLFDSIKRGIKNVKNAEIVICPPFVYLSALESEIMRPSFAISFGGQSCFWEEKGAFTGEVSPKMLKDLGCDYVILGHSERRKYLKETDEMINKKIKAALKSDLTPILCIENISQLKKGTKDLLRKEQKKLIIAYEPVFAIGTGKPCIPEKAKEMKTAIKKIIGEEDKSSSSPFVAARVNEDISIIYGGSVNSQNATDYIKMAGFQGLLVGGASLDSEEFIKLAKNVTRACPVVELRSLRDCAPKLF